MIDEAGDLTDLTIEIFKLLPATKKIIAGDPFQSIFSFMKCSNAFEYFKGEGISAPLTKTFRCSVPIANSIEKFVKTYLDKDFKFVGNKYPTSYKIKTKAYLSLTNAGLLAEMIELMKRKVPFKTTKDINSILEFPLVLANVTNGKPIKDTKYKAIELLRKSWIKHSDSPKFIKQYPNELMYIKDKLKEDEEVKLACSVVLSNGSKVINTITKYAKTCNAGPTDITLSTAHSSKGMTFDSVTIADDFNQRMVSKPSDELFRLYYVAGTRARVELNNALLLES
jgi:superfamily I DNA/RNA helicase